MIHLGFSCKYLAFTQYFKSTHQAVDIPKIVTVGNEKKTNEYVYMAYDGKIVRNAYASDYGWFVEYEVKDGNDTYLIASGHFDTKSPLEVGKTYKRLTVINPMGCTGKNSTGYHDHFRVTKNGVRVNPLDYCYAYTDWNVIGSKETANIMKYTPLPDIQGVERDESKNQLKVLVSGLRVRKEPNGEQIGWAIQNEIYNHLETQKINDLEWYKIDKDMWVGNNGNYVELLPTSNYKELYEEELVKNQKLELENKDLQLQLEKSNTKLNDINIIVNS